MQQRSLEVERLELEAAKSGETPALRVILIDSLGGDYNSLIPRLYHYSGKLIKVLEHPGQLFSRDIVIFPIYANFDSCIVIRTGENKSALFGRRPEILTGFPIQGPPPGPS